MIGQVISHYKILEKLGEGGMGVVFKAEDIKLKRCVALKFLPPELTRDEEAKKRFIQEAQAASSLEHPNICTVFEINETDDGLMFMVMLCYEGQTLKERLDKGANGRPPLPVDECIDIARQIAQGLAKAHERGIVHRDIKPANIFVTKDGVVKILDFGLAKLSRQKKLTKTGTTVGTVAYMSPEQARGGEVDHRTDIWSLGVVLYEMLTGQLPFRGEYDQAVIYSILNEEPEPIRLPDEGPHRAIIAFITKALAKNPSERHVNMEELLKDLRAILGNKGVNETLFPIRSGGLSRRRIVYRTAAVSALFLIIGGFVFSLLIKEKKPPWLQKDTKRRQLTSESGSERGQISPDGRYLVYQDAYSQIKIKVISTDEIQSLDISESSQHLMPSWLPDGESVVYCDWSSNQLKVISLMGTIRQQIPAKDNPMWPVVSPDGMLLAYIPQIQPPNTKILIMNLDGTNIRSFPMNGYPYSPAWCPDSRRLAFIERLESRGGRIRILDVTNGIMSDSLKCAAPLPNAWWMGGLAWSPDGRYMVYVGSSGNNQELFALPMNMKNGRAAGPPVAVTKLEGLGVPFWPAFTRDGGQLSFGIQTDNRDIYAMDLDLRAKAITGEPIAVATDRGPDFDPNWMPDGDRVLYRSFRNEQHDFYLYSLKTEETSRLTFSKTFKSSPKLSPDGKFISYFSEGGIRRIPSTGGPAQPLIPDSMKVGERYEWSSDGKSLFLTIEGNPKHFLTLIRYDLIHGACDTVLTSLLSGCADFAISPDGRRMAVSGIQVHPDSLASENIGLINLENMKISLLKTQKAFIPRGRLSWTMDGRFVLHDFFDSKDDLAYELLPAEGGTPIPMNLKRAGLAGAVFIDRIDASGKKVLVSVETEEADMWVLGGENN